MIKDIATKSKFLSQNRYLPIVLWLLPLILLNFGWYFLNYIDTHWEEQKRIAQSEQEVEDLAYKANFENCFEQLAKDFYNNLKSLVKTYPQEKQRKRLLEFVSKKAEKIFKAPFPKHELLVFHFPKINKENHGKPKIIFNNNQNIKNKKALEITFEYLVKVNIANSNYNYNNYESEKEKGAIIAKNVFGGECDPEVIAETQCGKASYAFYNLESNRIYWNYFENQSNANESNGDIYGFLLIVNNSDELEKDSKLITLKDFRDSQKNESEKKYCCFIPLFPGYSGVVTTKEFAIMPEFNELKKKWSPKSIKDLCDWQLNLKPDKRKNNIIGNYQAFFHIAPQQSHATVLLIPKKERNKIPTWLISFDFLIILIIIILLLRGIFWGIWPQMSLKTRFITTYFLASCIPLGLLAIISYGYISEYTLSFSFNAQTKLRNYINKFDLQKIKYQEKYRTAFHKIKQDSLFLESFKKLDERNIIIDNKLDEIINNLEKKKENELISLKKFEKIKKEETKNIIENDFLPVAKTVIDIFLKKWNKKELPFLTVTILDEKGNYITNLSGNLSYTYCKIDNQENELNYNNEAEKKKLIKDKALNDNSLNSISSSLLETLQNKIKNHNKPRRWKENEEENTNKSKKIEALTDFTKIGYEAALGDKSTSLSDDLEKRAGLIVNRQIGDRYINHIHEYIQVDGVPRFILYLFWDTNELDLDTYISTLDSLYLDNKTRECFFSAYEKREKTSQEIKPWPESKKAQSAKYETYKRHEEEYKQISLKLVNTAAIRKKAVSYNDNQLTAVVVPSRQYEGLYIIGGIFNNVLYNNIFWKVTIFIIVILLALIILFACFNYLSKILLIPISNLKESLDNVKRGNLDIEIKNNSKDEFGDICREFSEMTKELSERNRLATLLSDHAVEALNKKNEFTNSDVETFNGTFLVSDIRNFTGMCELYSPDEITNLLNEHFAMMTKIFSENGGRIYKFIGDAVEAVFADNDDFTRSSAERAFTASVEILNSLNTINQQRKEKGLFDYKIGIGLSYGEMSSGPIGSIDTRLDYAILGDTLKKAEKLESYSKFNPEFPIVVDKDFINVFKKFFVGIDFLSFKNENGLEGFKITDNGLNIFLTEKKDDLVRAEKVSQNKTVLNNNKVKNNVINSYKISKKEEAFALNQKLLSGLFFIILLSALLAGGFYLLNSLSIENQKQLIETDLQRVLEQLKQKDFGINAFDSLCRDFAYALNSDISDSENKTKINELINNSINNYYNSNSIFKELNLSKIFIKVDNSINKLDINNTHFVDNIKLDTLSNTGFNEKEIEKICSSYRVAIALNILDSISEKNKLDKSEIDQFQLPYKEYMAVKYGDISKEVFGEKLPITLLKNEKINTAYEVNFHNEKHYIYILDFYNNTEELIGYLVLLMPTKSASESLQMLLNLYSKNERLVFLHKTKKEKEEWHYSKNVPNYLKNPNHILASVNNDDDNQKYIKKDEIEFNNQSYNIYLAKFYKNNYIPLALTNFIVFVISIFMLYILIGIIKGKSIFNKTIASKLWLALLIVAVVPFLTMSFVFKLFVNEFYFVKVAQERDKIQSFSKDFEDKIDFGVPLVWNLIKVKNDNKKLIENSIILNKYSKELKINKDKKDIEDIKDIKDIKESKELERIICKWENETNHYTEEENLITNYSISDISITGKNSWDLNLNLSKKKEETTNNSIKQSVSYLDNKNSDQKKKIGTLLNKIFKSLFNRQENSINGELIANDIYKEMGLQTIKSYFGADVFVKLSNAIKIPIILNIGIGRLGLYISPAPDYKNAESYLTWIIKFNTYDYLLRLAKEISSDYAIYPIDNLNYGKIDECKDNNVRISFGNYGSWLSISNLPISDKLTINNKSYLIEAMPSHLHYYSMLIFTYPENNIYDKIKKMTYLFYILIAISILLIVETTRNITNDIIYPINILLEGIKEVKKENFSFRIDSDRTDELGSLCFAFDEMIKGLDEKRMMSRMLSKTARAVTLSEDFQNSTKSNSIFLYIGIPNFTKYLARYSKEFVFDSLKKQTAIIAELIMKDGGEIDKIIGEKMLVVFPIKKNNKKQALSSACKVAKKIIDNETTKRITFPVALGLNYGEVINGFLGIGNKRDFTVIGDAVNVTARIESIAENLASERCLISENLNNLVHDIVKTKEYGEFQLKGKSLPMKIYRFC